MPAITINSFEYEEDILDAAATAKTYNKTYKEVRDEIAAADDEKRRNALAYGNWMRSRQSGNYNHYSVTQGRELHEVAHISKGEIVCTCGLLTRLDYETQGEDDQAFWNAPGHIRVATRERVTLFVVKVHFSREIPAEHHYWCQNCGDIGNTIPTKAGNISLVGLQAIRKSHKCD